MIQEVMKMKGSRSKMVPEDAIWISKLEFEQLGQMTFEEFEKMDYGSCDLKFTSGGGRDVWRLVWGIINNRNWK
jgi:hypothetical protein